FHRAGSSVFMPLRWSTAWVRSIVAASRNLRFRRQRDVAYIRSARLYCCVDKPFVAHILQRRSLYEDVNPFGDQDRLALRGADCSVRWTRGVSEQRAAAITAERATAHRLYPGCGSKRKGS